MTTADRPPEVTIHPAKLPLRLPPESLHIRPDVDGVVAADPARAGWRYLSFRTFGLAEGETVLLDRPDQEAAIVTISGGGVEIAIDERSQPGSRRAALRLRGHALERLHPGRDDGSHHRPADREAAGRGRRRPGAPHGSRRREHGADRRPSGRRRDRDPRRRQRHPPGQQHHDAGLPGGPIADLRGVHTVGQLVRLAAAQARRRRSASGGGPRGDLLLPIRSPGGLGHPARLPPRRLTRPADAGPPRRPA